MEINPTQTMKLTPEPKPQNFIPEQSSANFQLTEQERQHLENLLLWQKQSENSTIILGKP
jgi:hypothetical protein